MKKTPTKTAKTPTPAPKSTVPAKAKAPKQPAPKAAAPKEPAPKKTTPSRVAAAVKTIHKTDPAPVMAAAIAAPSKTLITAKFDVGFGNTLFIRGVGPGLSWEKGVALSNSGEDLWTLILPESAQPVSFKVLVNDETWSSGEDYLVESGATITVVPTF
jgi:hypothetical protein